MSDDLDKTTNNDEEQSFEISPEEATSLDDSKPVIFNSKKLLIVICIAFSVIICGSLIINTFKSDKKHSDSDNESYAARQAQSNEFLTSLQNRAVRNRLAEDEKNKSISEEKENESEDTKEPEPLLPPVSFNNTAQSQPQPRNTYQSPPPPSQEYSQGYSGSQPQQEQVTYYHSSLVPPIQGRLFSQGAVTQPQAQPVSAQSLNRSPVDDYLSNVSRASSTYGNQVSNYETQNDQSGKQSFYDSSSGGTIFSGEFIGDNSLWVGTIIPGILHTAINTDLPGNVLARTTQNIYDSLTGKILLIPQGTLLIARYNSSVSYAQNRVQIVWDLLIRPDGYQVNLDGAPAVDKSGMSGQDAKYHENWFEYIKAAGIITMFSIANSKMAETVAKYSSDNSNLTASPNAAAQSVAQANANMVNEIGGNIISRAMNIQPRLTVENGTIINIMLNKNIYLPPAGSYSVNQKYSLR